MIAAGDLLRHEALLRDAASRDHLARLIVDLTPAMVGAERMLAFRFRRGRWRLEAASHVAVIEPDAPAVRALEARLEGEGDDEPCWTVVEPCDRSGRPVARIVVEGRAPPDAAARALLDRLRGAWAQGYLSFGARAPRAPLPRFVAGGLAAAAAALAFLPVPLTALAPFEIVARDPVVLRAPMDGVVAGMAVRADAAVAEGAVIATLDPREMEADLALAERRLDLADTRLATSGKDAFRKGGNGSDVILARAERSLALAERDAHAARLRGTVLVSPVEGIVLHEGRRRWHGRAVRTGEKLAEIAHPERVEAVVELAISDALVVERGSAVSLYPDGSLGEHAATLARISFLPEATADGRLVYPLVAQLEQPLRIGMRGTARLRGRTVPLWFRVLRRPLTALRQGTGL